MLSQGVSCHVFRVDPAAASNLTDNAFFAKGENKEALRTILRNASKTIGELPKVKTIGQEINADVVKTARIGLNELLNRRLSMPGHFSISHGDHLTVSGDTVLAKRFGMASGVRNTLSALAGVNKDVGETIQERA